MSWAYKKRGLIYATLFSLLMCTPPPDRFVVTNNNLNTREITLISKDITYKSSAGYYLRSFYESVSVYVSIEVENRSTESFTIDVRQFVLDSKYYEYDQSPTDEDRKMFKFLYEHVDENPVVEIGPGAKKDLDFTAKAHTTHQEMPKDEQMDFVIGKGFLGPKEIVFETIHFVPESVIKKASD